MSNRLTVYQGNTFVINDTVEDQAGTVVDLTTVTGLMTIYNGETAILTKSAVHTTAASGLTSYTITKAQTAAFPAPCVLRYETEYTYADGTKFTGLRDYIEVVADLT